MKQPIINSLCGAPAIPSGPMGWEFEESFEPQLHDRHLPLCVSVCIHVFNPTVVNPVLQ